MDEPQGLYDEQRLAAAGIDSSPVGTLRVADANHYTVLVGDEGAKVVAEQLLQSLAGWPEDR